jgi:hypothetical protein
MTTTNANETKLCPQTHPTSASLRSPNPASTSRLAVLPWNDELFNTYGYGARSTYTERFWLPIAGPTAITLARHCAARFAQQPQGFALQPTTLSACVGLAKSVANLRKTINRMVSFGLAGCIDGDVLAMRTAFPPLTQRMLHCLPNELQRAHTKEQANESIANPQLAQDRTMVGVALSALDTKSTLGRSPMQLDRALASLACRNELRVQLVKWLINQPSQA